MWCTNCGNKLSDQVLFCSECGCAVQRSVVETSPLPVVTDIAPQAPISTALAQPSKRKTARFVAVIIALLAAIVVLVVFFIKPKVNQVQEHNVATAVTTVTEIVDVTVAPPGPVESSHTGFDRATLNQIVAGYGDAAVAATYGDELYESALSNESRINVGFYVPIWMAALTSGNSNAINLANNMMQNMDKDSGNQAIAALGGFTAINNWVQKERWVFTNYARSLGDETASSRGLENYTSARDAVGIMKQALRYNLPANMTGPISNEGILTPAGTTVVGHTGQGIQNMSNFYIVMTTSTQTICIAVITQNQGKERAVQLTNQILANLAATV